MIVGIIEWNSDDGREPEVFIADTADAVRRAVAQRLFRSLPHDQNPTGEIDDIDREWVAEHPIPNLDNPEAVTAWLEELRDTSTDAWLTLYGPETSQDITSTYTELPKPV